MTASASAREHVATIALAASNKLASDIVALDVSDILPFADAFVLCSGRNERMVQSIAEAIEEAMADIGVSRLRQEGRSEGRWILLDFGDVIVHVFHEEERLYYQLERLWRDAPVIALPEQVQPPADS